jgi:hypothetical protein
MAEYMCYLNAIFFLFSQQFRSIKQAFKNLEQFLTSRSIKGKPEVRALKLKNYEIYGKF